MAEALAKLGIVAGGGDLPSRLIAACRELGREFFVLALRGHAEPDLTDGAPHKWIALGEVGPGLDALHGAECRELVLAGRVRRPSWKELRLDRRGMALAARLVLRAGGDDALLKGIIAALEKEGFRVIGPDAVLTTLLAPEGTLGAHAPDDAASADIARGFAVLRGLGALDVGQAVAVQEGVVLAVEAAEGTDAMIDRAGRLRRDGAGPVLVKAAKPGQEVRADLPTVGPDTIGRAAAAGFRGVAVEAGRSLIVDRDAMVRAADEAGLFVIAAAMQPG